MNYIQMILYYIPDDDDDDEFFALRQVHVGTTYLAVYKFAVQPVWVISLNG